MERDYYLRFSLVNGIGPKTFLQLLKYFKSAEKAWNSSSIELKKSGLGEKTLVNFERYREKFDFNSYLKKLKQKKASFIAICDKKYPKLLAQIPNPPIVLFAKGDTELLQGSVEEALRSPSDFDESSNASVPAKLGIRSRQVGTLAKMSSQQTAPRALNNIAVVGTRKITSYGREVTRLFSFNLASSGFTIVSGLAMGVDAVAAWSAIEAGGKTIAVLGNGVDLCFPSSNEALYDKILGSGGLIISEFPLGQSPTMGSFPSRNRIIAGLSLGVLVTEGTEDSGSLITADYAFKFKRKVFAIPGPITSSLSKTPLKLIERGAKLVVDAEGVLKELEIQNSKLKILTQNSKVKGETKNEQKILSILENESLGFDEIVRRLGIDSSKAGILLSIMEIKGIVRQSNGEYALITE